MLGACAIGHGHAIARRDVRIRRVQIDLAAAACGQQRNRRRKCFHPIVLLVKNVRAQTTVAVPDSEFPAGNQIDGQVIFKNENVRLSRNGIEQRGFNLMAGHVPGVQNTPPRVSSFAPQIQLVRTVISPIFRLGKFHPELNQFLNAGLPFLDNRPHDRFFAQPCARLEGIAHVQFK